MRVFHFISGRGQLYNTYIYIYIYYRSFPHSLLFFPLSLWKREREKKKNKSYQKTFFKGFLDLGFFCAPQTNVLTDQYTASAICVQRFDDSLSPAIHTTYRISLRSSSLREPRYPLLRVVFRLFKIRKKVFTFFQTYFLVFQIFFNIFLRFIRFLYKLIIKLICICIYEYIQKRTKTLFKKLLREKKKKILKKKFK